jgi:hypothetical protein
VSLSPNRYRRVPCKGWPPNPARTGR